VDSYVGIDLLDVIVLLTSEVVTNAVLHARTKARLTVLVTTRKVRIEVVDGDAREPVPRQARADDTSGRGMQLVDVLSSRWGAEPYKDGKRVWFEVDVS
jgi:anti-sigma regulatory factor (Ser/Thr protein kinase)